MAGEKTVVTELATALGITGASGIADAIARRMPSLRLSDDEWERLGDLYDSGRYHDAFEMGFANGRAFLHSPDTLVGRRPRIVEWTGGRRPPGDEVVPSDLRIDHVYLVSCKYLSRVLHNLSPARLVDGLLTRGPIDDRSDWYQRVAPEENQALYAACRRVLGAWSLPAAAIDLGRDHRKLLKRELSAGWPGSAGEEYQALSAAVSQATADRWRANLDRREHEAMLWRLLRVGSAPYFVLGASSKGSMRLRVDTPWDWRQNHRLDQLTIEPEAGGQPRVSWRASYVHLPTDETREVRGHVEVRWSHGRFAQPPEAKVYLDTPHEDVPGYHPL